MTDRDTPCKIGLVQINNSFADACYFPYSVGILQAYVQRYARRPQAFEFRTPIYRRLTVQAALNHLAGVQVAGFSVYVWNYRLSLAIAEALKAADPKVLIVFGGPHVPDHAESFLRDHPFIDLAVHGEGERVFLNILEQAGEKRWEGISGLSYLQDGRFNFTERAERISDLGTVPSPYLEGVFDVLAEQAQDHDWLGLWETNRGCPFNCSYCDWGSANHQRMYNFDLERLEKEVQWFADHRIEFVFCCDSNFGLLPRDLDIVKIVVSAKHAHGFPKSLSVQNTKNATERTYAVQSLLNREGLSKGVNLALQTTTPAALDRIGRKNISLDSFRELQEKYNRDNIETFTDLILGLPGETYQSFVEGVEGIIRQGQHNRIQFINLSILPNAEMGDPAYQRRYDFEIVETNIVNIHGLETGQEDGIFETQKLVVGTDSMPRPDWIKARVFAWMMSLVHFDKVLQIPNILLNAFFNVPFTGLVNAFLEADADRYPVTAGIKAFFEREAGHICEGGPEYYHSPEFLNIYWPHDEFVLIRLCAEGNIENFYQEAKTIIRELAGTFLEEAPDLLDQAVDLNRRLLKKPFQTQDEDACYRYNLFELYRSVLTGDRCELSTGERCYRIDKTSENWIGWDDWCREVVWYGNKKGAYLYHLKHESNGALS